MRRIRKVLGYRVWAAGSIWGDRFRYVTVYTDPEDDHKLITGWTSKPRWACLFRLRSDAEDLIEHERRRWEEYAADGTPPLWHWRDLRVVKVYAKEKEA